VQRGTGITIGEKLMADSSLGRLMDIFVGIHILRVPMGFGFRKSFSSGPFRFTVFPRGDS
jgi:hypothetical protein